MANHTTTKAGPMPAHRPRIEPERGARKDRKITITDDRWEQARKLGKGSASEGIAMALDAIEESGK